MQSYHNRNCLLRTAVYTITDRIIELICNTKGGYVYWMSLPLKGRKNKDVVRKEMCDYILHEVYSDSFIRMLLLATFDVNGRPVNKEMYTWLMVNVYSGNVREMYNDWMESKRLNTIDNGVM